MTRRARMYAWAPHRSQRSSAVNSGASAVVISVLAFFLFLMGPVLRTLSRTYDARRGLFVPGRTSRTFQQ
ncbi:hypothetical protein GCM10027053_04770 [Intrasporangium mesophilum]